MKGQEGERDSNKRIGEYAIVKPTIRKGGKRKNLLKENIYRGETTTK